MPDYVTSELRVIYSESDALADPSWTLVTREEVAEMRGCMRTGAR